MPIQYFKNSTFGVIINWSGRVGSGEYFARDRLEWSGWKFGGLETFLVYLMVFFCMLYVYFLWIFL